MSTDNCIFCQIIDGSIPADIYYQDEDVLAFRDIHPVAPPMSSLTRMLR